MLPVDPLKQGARLLRRSSCDPRNCVDIPVSRVVGIQLRLTQKRRCVGVVVLTHQKQTKGMHGTGIFRFDGQDLAQQVRAVRVHPAHSIKICEIHKRRNEFWLKSERGSIFPLRIGRLPLPRVQ
jgi:hypothetical protein